MGYRTARRANGLVLPDGFRSYNHLPWLRPETVHAVLRIPIKGHDQELVFYKSTISDRWWYGRAIPGEQEARFERHHLVPCSYGDYQAACREEVPDRWWRTFQKLA